MHSVSQLWANLPNPTLPARHVREYVDNGQSEAFFHLAVAKDARIDALRERFSRSGLRGVYLSSNLGGFECSIDGINVGVLDKNYFEEPDLARRGAKLAQLQGCIVIVNNNDAGSTGERQAYTDFFSECDATFFIAWDWDNHHWLELSSYLAAHSDLYAPSHHENLYLLSRYNWRIAGPVYCSSVQWSRKYLTEHLPEILVAQRSEEPLGRHIPYTQFDFRLRMISTLNQYYPTIGFSSHAFHVRTPGDRLQEWCSHKTHWIAPVLNDVPIRIFDALATGGIPIVPNSLRFLPPVSSIPREFIEFYSAADIVSPQACVGRANALFDGGGCEGVVARHRLALQNFHGDASVRQMLGYAAEVLGIRIECQ